MLARDRVMGLSLALLIVLLFSGCLARADGNVSGRVLVRLKPGASITDIDSEYETETEDGIAESGIFALTTPEGEDDASFATRLHSDDRVAYAELDQYLTLPYFTGDPFHFPFDITTKQTQFLSQAAFAQVGFRGMARKVIGSGVTIAVLDTGVAFQHPAIKNRLFKGFNALNPKASAADVADGKTNLQVGHGTMVAGMIALLAPGAKIIPVRILNGDGTGTLLSVLKGLEYARKRGAKVINMSFGTSQTSQALEEELARVRAANIVLVAAVGNEGSDKVLYPAASAGVLAVSSVERDNSKSPYANYGFDVAVVAPGSYICSAYYAGGYAYGSGTSFAVPFVAAQAALMIAARPNLKAPDIITRIRNTAHPVDAVNTSFTNMLGTGVIDMERGVNSVWR